MDSSSKELVQTISERPYWFESCEEQHLSSAATNSVEEDWENWTGPTQYNPPSGASLPFTVIKDNTEGIAGIADLVFPADANTFLDIGGGRFNATGQWLKRQRTGAEYHVLDPFNRPKEENLRVQRLVSESKVDVVLSISVLNVIAEKQLRSEHIAICFLSLKEHGVAYFKVWAGSWPARGSGVGDFNEERRAFQANSWASAFESEVKAIFGQDNVFCDQNLNLIVAQKS